MNKTLTKERLNNLTIELEACLADVFKQENAKTSADLSHLKEVCAVLTSYGVKSIFTANEDGDLFNFDLVNARFE